MEMINSTMLIGRTYHAKLLARIVHVEGSLAAHDRATSSILIDLNLSSLLASKIPNVRPEVHGLLKLVARGPGVSRGREAPVL